MIEQGTDSLSRGVWCSPWHGIPDQRTIAAHVFSPIQPDFTLINSIVKQFGLSTRWIYCDWHKLWTSYAVMDSFTVWFPPPELARQLLIEILTLWSERPLSTQALFIIPRVLSGF